MKRLKYVQYYHCMLKSKYDIKMLIINQKKTRTDDNKIPMCPRDINTSLGPFSCFLVILWWCRNGGRWYWVVWGGL